MALRIVQMALLLALFIIGLPIIANWHDSAPWSLAIFVAIIGVTFWVAFDDQP